MVAVSGALAEDQPDLPWVFNAPRADGYTIDLVEVQPTPGKPLLTGDSVEFKVRVKYTLSVASHGLIVLVFQDDKNRSATPTQLKLRVDKPAGEVTLSDRVAIPADANELRLFIPLVPEGLTSTTGEVTIRYPVRKPLPTDNRWRHP